MTTNDLWFTARGAGLAAMLILTIATVLGALGSMRLRSAGTRVVVQYVHRTAAVLGLLLIVVHVSTLVLDAKSHISLAGALVPFAAQYRPSAVAFGSIATYLLVFVAALGFARGRLASSRLGAATWRGLHLLAYPAWGIAIVHGLMAGTDRTQNWVVLLTIGCIVAVLIAALCRIAGLTADEFTATPPSSTKRLTGASR
jgi:DMSO/TMAO reductase YedYZ heme-binding membrane subunit